MIDSDIPTWQKFIVWGLGVVASMATILRWLFWPRTKQAIEEVVEEKLKPVWAEVHATAKLSNELPQIRLLCASIQQTVDEGINRLTRSTETIADEVTQQGKDLAQVRGQLIERGLAYDRRHNQRGE